MPIWVFNNWWKTCRFKARQITCNNQHTGIWYLIVPSFNTFGFEILLLERVSILWWGRTDSEDGATCGTNANERIGEETFSERGDDGDVGANV